MFGFASDAMLVYDDDFGNVLQNFKIQKSHKGTQVEHSSYARRHKSRWLLQTSKANKFSCRYGVGSTLKLYFQFRKMSSKNTVHIVLSKKLSFSDWRHHPEVKGLSK